MRRYETIVIIDPDLSDEDRGPLLEKTSDLIPQQGGLLVEVDTWGNKKLAYEIKKKPRGYYVRLDYCGSGALVDEMERSFRIDDRVLKYMTVLLEKDVDVEQIKADLAQKAEEEKAQAEQAAAAETAEAPPSDVPQSEPAESQPTQPESNEEE